MNRKFYIQPQVRTMEVRTAQILAVSIKDGMADPNEQILVKEKYDWDIFGEYSNEETELK